MSKRTKKESPLTKGAALTQAREILGPGAQVFFDKYDSDSCCIEVEHGSEITFEGPTWKEAITKAKASPEARAWSDAKILCDNHTAEAEDSLKKARKVHFQTSLAKLLELTESRFKKIKVRLQGSAGCRCGKKISANKNHCADCPSEIVPELPEVQYD